jgi:LysM repeat protein
MLSIKIPSAQITKIKPVLARKKANGEYESMTEVKARVGCTHIINAGTYNMTTYALDSGLTIDGKVLKAGYHGFGTKDEKTLQFIYAGTGMKDYFGAFHDIIREGKYWEESKMNDTSNRGRTGLGINPDGSITIVSIGDTEAKYKCGSTAFMSTYFKGCTYAINLDGGGSSQWITPNSKFISGRHVAWYLCLWIKETTTTNPTPTKPATKPTTTTTTTTSSYIIHTVKSGESLSSIASKYGTTYTKIAKDNGIKNVNVIHVGQRLKVYKGVK